jgi:hypothetical protein
MTSKKDVPMNNAIMVIFPYRKNGVWMFDDDAVGLKQEPFVCGVPEMIDVLVADIKDAEKGFAAYFSGQPFPGARMHLKRVREEHGGNWYQLAGTDTQGWLCPAMFKYFAEAPSSLFVKAGPAL